MQPDQATMLRDRFKNKKVVCLDIKDNYPFRDPELKKQIAENYQKAINA